MALASDRPTLGKWKWKFPQLAEISDSGRTCATLLLEYFRYWFYNVNRRWLIGSSWGRWNFATIEVKCSLSLRMETCFERWWWEIVNWVSKVRINVWDGSCKTHFWTPRKFSWSPKVCFTATIPYINPNFRYSVHYFSSSPFKTCFHSKTKTALHFNGCKIPSPSWTSY